MTGDRWQAGATSESLGAQERGHGWPPSPVDGWTSPEPDHGREHQRRALGDAYWYLVVHEVAGAFLDHPETLRSAIASQRGRSTPGRVSAMEEALRIVEDR